MLTPYRVIKKRKYSYLNRIIRSPKTLQKDMNTRECAFSRDIVKQPIKVSFMKLLDAINIKYLVGKIIRNEAAYFMFVVAEHEREFLNELH